MDTRKIVKGSFWIVALEVCNQLLQFIKTFYAARILVPADFGIVGLAFLVIAFIDVFLTTGMKEAIIQRKDDLQSYLSTVWIIEVGKGSVILMLSFFLAGVLEYFVPLANPALTTGVIRFIGCVYFALCCTNIGVIYFEKNLQFKQYFLYQFCGTATDVVISLVLVTTMKSVWGLFYGILAGNVVKAATSYFIVAFRPKFEFDLKKAKELLHFGKWIFKGRVFTFLGLQLDSMIVSGFFSLYSLGIYQMAFRIGSLPISQVSNIMGKIVFPAFSRIQDDAKKLKEHFLTGINILSISLLPLVIAVYCLIYEFTLVFLGAKWIEIVPVVRILIVLGYMRIIAGLMDYLFWAIGDPKLSSNFQFYRFVVFGIIAFPLIYYLQISGVAITALLALTIVFIVYFRKICLRLGITFGEVKADLLYPVLYAVLIGVLVLVTKDLVPFEGVVGLFCKGFFILTIYVVPGLIITRYSQLRLFGKTISTIRSFIHKQ